MHLSRREFLGAGAAAACASLVGCAASAPVSGSFLQPWRSHLEMPRDQWRQRLAATQALGCRSEEHTSELQSHSDLVCRLLLEKKNKIISTNSTDVLIFTLYVATSPVC